MMLLLPRIFLFACGIVLATSASTTARAGAKDGVAKVFAEWAVGCDNQRLCQAKALMPEGNDPEDAGNLDIEIKRGGAPQDRAQLILRMDTPQDGSTYSRYLFFDDQKVSESAFSKLRFANGVAELHGKEALRLIAAMRERQTIRVVDMKGYDLASASLAGLKAALRFIDENQFRVGTVSALVAIGTKPANAITIPPMLPLPSVQIHFPYDAPPTRLDKAALMPLRKLDPCLKYSDENPTVPVEEDDRLDPSAIEQFHRLDHAHTLLIIPTLCGGYNPASMIMIIDQKGAARPAPFVPFDNSIVDFADGYVALPDPVWDQEKRVLSSHGKTRGLRDCGQIQRYAWDGESFVIVFAATMPDCRGSFDYITTYRRDLNVEPVSIFACRIGRTRSGKWQRCKK